MRGALGAERWPELTNRTSERSLPYPRGGSAAGGLRTGGGQRLGCYESLASTAGRGRREEIGLCREPGAQPFNPLVPRERGGAVEEAL